MVIIIFAIINAAQPRPNTFTKGFASLDKSGVPMYVATPSPIRAINNEIVKNQKDFFH